MTSGDTDTRTKWHQRDETNMNESGTHNRFSPATVVGLLEDGQKEIIEVELPLKREFVIGVENVEGERSPWSIEGCGVPAYPQKLVIPLDPFGIFCACTELHVDIVSSVGIDHENNTNLRVHRRTNGMLVTDVEYVTQVT